jgi:CRP/FNR family transcriptional regulator
MMANGILQRKEVGTAEDCLHVLREKFSFLFEEELILDMCRSGKLRQFQEGDLILDIGQILTHMPVVIAGSIKIMREDADGNELLLYYLEPGDTCAATLSCCSRAGKSSLKAVAEAQGRILMIPIEKMEQWMIHFKSWRNFVLESYNTRLNEMLDAIDNLAFNNMEDRLKKYLKDKVLITKDPKLQITHFQISGELNSSRVVISRLMKKLEMDGFLLQQRNYVEVKEFMR